MGEPVDGALRLLESLVDLRGTSPELARFSMGEWEARRIMHTPPTAARGGRWPAGPTRPGTFAVSRPERGPCMPWPTAGGTSASARDRSDPTEPRDSRQPHRIDQIAKLLLTVSIGRVCAAIAARIAHPFLHHAHPFPERLDRIGDQHACLGLRELSRETILGDYAPRGESLCMAERASRLLRVFFKLSDPISLSGTIACLPEGIRARN